MSHIWIIRTDKLHQTHSLYAVWCHTFIVPPIYTCNMNNEGNVLVDVESHKWFHYRVRYSYETLECRWRSQECCWTGHNVTIQKKNRLLFSSRKRWKQNAHGIYIFASNLLFIWRFLVKWNEIILYYGNVDDDDDDSIRMVQLVCCRDV